MLLITRVGSFACAALQCACYLIIERSAITSCKMSNEKLDYRQLYFAIWYQFYRSLAVKLTDIRARQMEHVGLVGRMSARSRAIACLAELP